MADQTEIDGKRGESLSNIWTTERFTCPVCLTDHDVRGLSEDRIEQRKYVRCECGAPLLCEIEMAPEAKCVVLDADDEEEYLSVGATMRRREVDTSKAKCRECGGAYTENEPTYSVANKWDETVEDKDVLLEFEHWKCHTPTEKLFENMRATLAKAEGLLGKLRKH